MKFQDIPANVQAIAASLLLKELDADVYLSEATQSEKAAVIASTIRVAFESLYSNSDPIPQDAGCDSGIGVKV